MAIIRIENFTGIAPKIDPKKLPQGGAQFSKNCMFDGGDLRSLFEPDDDGAWTDPSSGSTTVRTLFPYGNYWLTWSVDVNAVNSPVVGEKWGRVYWSRASGAPQVIIRDAIGSGGSMDGKGTDLGIKRPEFAPQATTVSGEEPQIEAATLSQTTPVRVATATAHPFKDGQRVIVTFAKRDFANVDDNPPDRTGMSELAGKTFTVRAVTNEGTGIVDLQQFDLIGADGANYSAYDPDNWIATIKRVYTDADMESRSYVYTYVSHYDEESQPSDASDVIDVLKNATVTVKGFAITGEQISAGYKIRLYRAITGQSGTAFFFLKEVSAMDAGSGILDDVPQERVGEMLPSESWAPPPNGIAGLLVMPGGFMAAFKGNMLHFSEPYMPHAWPETYTRTVQDEVVGIGVFAQTLVVATTGKPYLASGADPSSVSLQQLDDHAPCINAKCLTATGTGVIYPTSDGLVHVSTAGVRRLTQNHYSRNQWMDLLADAKCAIWHDGKYVLSTNGTIIFFEPHEGGLHIGKVEYYQATKIGYRSPNAFAIQPRPTSHRTGEWPGDTLFYAAKVASGSGLIALNVGSGMDAEWASKVFSLDRPVAMSCGQVYAAKYPVTLKVYAGKIDAGSKRPKDVTYPENGGIVHTVVVNSPEPFRLPSGFMAREWRIDVSGKLDVQAVCIASSMDELKQV